MNMIKAKLKIKDIQDRGLTGLYFKHKGSKRVYRVGRVENGLVDIIWEDAGNMCEVSFPVEMVSAWLYDRDNKEYTICSKSGLKQDK